MIILCKLTGHLQKTFRTSVIKTYQERKEKAKRIGEEITEQ